MPLFALEQIVLLSFAERERASPPPRVRARARDARTRRETRREEKSATKSAVLVASLCFFRSVLPLLADG